MFGGALGSVMESYVAFLLAIVLIFGIFYGLKHVLEALNHISESLLTEKPQNNIDIDGIKQELLDIVEDTISNLQPPNAFDHLMGALAQFAQHKIMMATGMDVNRLQEFLPEDGLNAVDAD